MRGLRLFAPRWKLPTLPTDEFYHADLIGMAVADAGGRKLGRVKAVHDFGAGDMLEVTGPEGKSALLPFTREAVPIVDLAAARIVVDPPEGIFPDDGREDEPEPEA